MKPFIRFALFSLAVAFSSGLMAAPADAPAAPAAAASSSLNPVLMGLGALALVLMLAIGVLANVMKSLAFLHMDKIKKDREAGLLSKAAATLLILTIGAGTAIAGEAATAEATEAAVQAAPAFIAGIPSAHFYGILGFIGFEMLAILAMVWQVQGLLKALRATPEKAVVAKKILKKNFLDVFNKSVAVEKEEGILMDHEYDGIRELDNSLPPWWKWGFAFTILMGAVYLWYYHVGDGPNQHEEYIAAVEKAEIEKMEYLAKSANNVDENTIAMTSDAAVVADGQKLFATNCAACHGGDGGGTVGPNLTDDYWLHGGSIKDVFVSVKYGWPDKGMKSWKDDFSPKQIAAISTYIKTLKGSKPAAPKAPQGDLYVEGTDKPAEGSAKPAEPVASATAETPKPLSDASTGATRTGL